MDAMSLRDAMGNATGRKMKVRMRNAVLSDARLDRAAISLIDVGDGDFERAIVG